MGRTRLGLLGGLLFLACASAAAEAACPPEYLSCSPSPSSPSVAKTRCVAPEYLCDGFYDCADLRDETNCTSCNGDTMLCDGECRRRKYWCDKSEDCIDHEDEIHCAKLEEISLLLPCANSDQSRDPSLFCDGRRDCRNGADETEDSCTDHRYWDNCDKAGAVLCHGKKTNTFICLPKRFVCDGHEDCVDGTDEESSRCLHTTVASSKATREAAAPGERTTSTTRPPASAITPRALRPSTATTPRRVTRARELRVSSTTGKPSRRGGDGPPQADESKESTFKEPWVFVLLGVGLLTVIAGLTAFFVVRRKRRSSPAMQCPEPQDRAYSFVFMGSDIDDEPSDFPDREASPSFADTKRKPLSFDRHTKGKSALEIVYSEPFY